MDALLVMGRRIAMRHSIFALEICARLDRAPSLLGLLRNRITSHPVAVTHQEKWQFYRQCAGDLLAHLGDVERGCWDFFDDDGRALRDYDMWVKGMTTEEGARTEPSGSPDAYRGGEPRYMTFTMAFLILNASPTERALSELCAVPESDLWKRATFARILNGLGILSFASVQSDVVYLIPRDDDWALTLQDLQDSKFEYLRTLEE